MKKISKKALEVLFEFIMALLSMLGLVSCIQPVAALRAHAKVERVLQAVGIATGQTGSAAQATYEAYCDAYAEP